MVSDDENPVSLASGVFGFVRPAGRTHLEVEVLYTPDRGKC